MYPTGQVFSNPLLANINETDFLVEIRPNRSARPASAEPPNPEFRSRANRRKYTAAEKLSIVERAEAAKEEGGISTLGALGQKRGWPTRAKAGEASLIIDG